MVIVVPVLSSARTLHGDTAMASARIRAIHFFFIFAILHSFRYPVKNNITFRVSSYRSVQLMHGSMVITRIGTSARSAPLSISHRAGRFAKVGVRRRKRSIVFLPLAFT